MSRIGIFGGSFNPIHKGHINCVKTATEKLNLEQTIVVPAYESPGRPLIQGPSPQQRYELVKLAFSDSSEKFLVDGIEIQRKGVSYTIDTLREIHGKHQSDELYLIIGKDQFENFENWKDFEKILALSNLVVTSRPGHEDPLSMEYMAKLKLLVSNTDNNEIELTTGKKIILIELDDIDVSASEVRRLLKNGESVQDLVPEVVERKIREEKLYQPLSESELDYEEFVRFCAKTLDDKKAFNVAAKDLRGADRPGEFVIICSGTSRKQATSLAENLIRAVKTKYNFYPLHIEGQSEGRWIVLDYGPVIIHVFYDFTRQEYLLEELWEEFSDFPVLQS